MGFFNSLGNAVTGFGSTVAGGLEDAFNVSDEEAKQDAQDEAIKQGRRDSDEKRAEAGAVGATAGAQNLNFGSANDQNYRDALDAERQRNQNRTSPTARGTTVAQGAGIDTREGQYRSGQDALIQQLTNQANGVGPSLAQNQLQQATSQTLSNALAAQAANRGQGSALAGRNLLNAQGQVIQQAAGQSANLALQEQQAAQGQLAGVLGQARGQDQQFDIEKSRQEQQRLLAQAGFDSSKSLADLSAQLQTEAGQAQMVQFLLTQGFNQNEAERKAREMAAQLALQERQGFLQASLEDAKLQAAIDSGDMELVKSIIGTAGNITGGALAVASDINVKQNIDALSLGGIMGSIKGNLSKMLSDKREKQKKEKPDVQELLSKLKAYSYEYKDKDLNGSGKRMGVMAQDLEKSELGKSMVQDTERGKMVDVGSLANAAMASAAALNERQNELEDSVLTIAKAINAKRKK